MTLPAPENTYRDLRRAATQTATRLKRLRKAGAPQAKRREARAAAEEAQQALQMYLDALALAKIRNPWMADPRAGNLARQYLDAWAEFGDAETALDYIRQKSPTYDKAFPGIKDDMGMLVMDEQEYIGVMRGYEDALNQYGINNARLRAKLPELITADVSTDEFKARLELVDSRISAQEPELQRIYGEYFGIENINRNVLMAMAVDPTINRDILDRNISIAELGNEAVQAGYSIPKGLAERMYQAEISLARGQEIFRGAAATLPGLQAASRRQREGGYSLGSYLEMEAFGDPTQARRARRIVAGEQSDFTEQAGFGLSEEGAMTGLRRR